MIESVLTGTDEGWAPAPILDWLFREGRFLTDPNELTRELGIRMHEAGAPIVRLRLAMRTLHPLLAGWSAVWQASGELERDRVATHGLERKASYVGSPLAHVRRTRTSFRRRLDASLGATDHALLHDLAAQGATDYLAMPLVFTTGQSAAMVVVTDRAGGFTETDLSKFEALAVIVSPILEVASAHTLARTVATAYIGPRSGARVLQGRIKRGDVETQQAAIWFSDLRDWSRLANELPASEAVALANSYFEVVDAAVTEADGEVLKLIGDAVLAIFPVDEDPQTACRAAIGAAHNAQERAQAYRDRFAFGIGLHLGEIVYGNVGSPTRLDFTVMGRAVNLAARIEKLTRPLSAPVVLSEDLAKACDLPCADLGAHAVAGWDRPVRVFAPIAPA
ncbi:MAG: adenylate/guanylate cyclase domain-containing protein [Alphaproteobacteria bacterium]|nr:adenylate/guanylate cyclase domain-containing protein [Alphaproteobacteria bacterium]